MSRKHRGLLTSGGIALLSVVMTGCGMMGGGVSGPPLINKSFDKDVGVMCYTAYSSSGVAMNCMGAVPRKDGGSNAGK